MTSFSRQHGPQPPPLGPEIPSGVRRAIASWFGDRDVKPDEIRRLWFQRLGYGSVNDVVEDVEARWGTDVAAAYHEALEDDRAVAQWHDGQRRQSAATAISFLHVPAPLYLDYLELAVEWYVRENSIIQAEYAEYFEDPTLKAAGYVNGLFASRGIVYRLNEQGRMEWHGDEGAYQETIRPALDALADARLVGVRQEFDAALNHLRSGTPKDLEDAIEEAGKSVESAMKVVLDARGGVRDGKETAEKLWQMLRDAGVVETPTHDAIVATSRLRNEWGGHGQGASIRQIPMAIPELSTHTASAAIAYLVALLP